MTSPPITTSFLSAALGLSRSAVDDDSDLLPQHQHLALLASLIPDLAPSLPLLHDRLLNELPHSDVSLFRRARHTARPHFPAESSPVLLQLAAELLTLVSPPSPSSETNDDNNNNLPIVTALSLVLQACITHPSQHPSAENRARFHIVLLASSPPAENAAALASLFFNPVRAFANGAHLPSQEQLVLSVTLVPAPHPHPALFDRFRDRLAIRLALLSTAHLGWGEDFRGSVQAPYSYHGATDPFFVKRIHSDEPAHHSVHQIANTLSSSYPQYVADLLRKSIDGDLGTVRLLFLSHGSWTHMALGSHALRHASEHIRTFTNASGLKCLEMRLDEFNEWDNAVFRQALLTGLSVSVLVFRFATLHGLGRYIGRSKQITDTFPGLTSDLERIIFVDTATTSQFAEARVAVQEVVVERRLFQPRAFKDILFEATDSDFVDQCISDRAKQNRSILHADLKGPCRTHMEDVIHILNREISLEDAQKESLHCARFLLRLKSAINTKVTIKKDPQLISICRGDSTGFGMSGTDLTRLMSERDYRDFRDITERQPFMVDAKIRLGAVAADLHDVGLFSWKWKVVTQMAGMVGKDGGLLMTVADERKTVLERGARRFVTGVSVTILGGGMQEYLQGKLIRSCVEAVRTERGQEEQVAMRTLLRLIPGLSKLVRNSRRS